MNLNFDKEKEKINRVANSDVAKIVAVGAVVFLGIYAGSYLMRASTRAVTSFKELRNAIKS